MVLRALLSYLTRNEQVIQKLSESYPMRRAAQMSAYIFLKGKEMGEDSLEKFKESDSINRVKHETEQRLGAFTKEIKDGFKEISDDIKKRQR